MHFCIKLLNSLKIRNIKFPALQNQFWHITICNYTKKSKMPKNNQNALALKEARLKNMKLSKGSRYPPGEIYLCVLGNGSISSPRSLYMFTDHERYLFNCGEGTQRLAQEHKTKLAKLENVFITHKSWENIGGLLGLSLTLQDVGLPKITLHGPANLDILYANADQFIVLNNLEIVMKNFMEEKFSDDSINVQYIPIFAESIASESSSSSSDIECTDSSSPDSSVDPTIEPKSKKLCMPCCKRFPDMILAYACKGHSKPGHLLYDKCVELGVPAGPLLGYLKNGKDVTLPSGKIIYSKDVVSEAQHCPLFLVVECPSVQFLSPFVNEEKFHQYQTDSSISSHIASLVVHFTPPEILKSAEYQQWMNKFPESTCHLILNNDNSTLNSIAAHRVQHKLNLLHPGIFSLLHESMVTENCTENQRPNEVQACTLERYHLRPDKGLDRSTALKFNFKEFTKEAMQTAGFEKSLKNLQNNILYHSCSQSNASYYPVVTFLGTGSSIPSKARNVSAILVKTSDNEYMLLDCGEGTYGQLARLFGENLGTVLRNLICVFISHMHADHHLGLITILKEREATYRKFQLQHQPLLIIAPQKLNKWLKKYHKTFERLTYQYRFIDCTTIEYNPFKNHHNVIENSLNVQISTVEVDHCPDAYGIVLSQKDPEWKLVYSGDTRPCERLVTAGQNCSMLIHEATMEDELADDAVIKKHSTTSEAIKIGEKMKSQYTILTHFSQRYAKIPLFNENFHNHVGCAFDNMTVGANEMYILPLLIPTLKCLFADEVEDLYIRGDKRRKKIELLDSASI